MQIVCIPTVHVLSVCILMYFNDIISVKMLAAGM